MVEYPIILQSIFSTWTISHHFKYYEDLEKWLDERKLTLTFSAQIGEYLVCIAKASDVPDMEILLS